ncbi:low temperature requirement protein A [Phenylobacterium sp. NIBR 498073]|uniref:low temperature requirement protein A n=1 Tax=Phenylobacterium sp. NIBR 498073 TaxID=3015177 RepID=UPI0022B45456|nr:low temperature requirement protein A [Phenylobacterium sp. NIBR 498073]WGU38666.1 low temperature requirement protein A [Phenylobacterium sp. NIBR 498073]
MGDDRREARLQRVRDGHGHHRVTYIELFFDLVFVFAITQLSHGLLHHLTPLGAFQAALLFLAVWWVWIYTCWITNWLDPERPAVRLLLLALMLAGLVMSMSLPEAFEDKGLTFAIAFVLMQVGRSLFVAWALRRHNARNYRNFLRITAWLAVSGACWIAGGLSEGPQRMALWGLAVAIEFASPSLGFWTPGLGRSTTADWDVEGGHMAERCALFVIIALGETLLMTGATVAELPREAGVLTAFGAAFAASVAMWWIYFDAAAERASRTFASSDDPGKIARLAYTYFHLPLVAGIVVSAVGDELALVHPNGHVDLKTGAVLLAGPALYLAGDLLFRRVTTQRIPRAHVVALAALAALVPAAGALSPALLSVTTSSVLVAVAAAETFWRREAAA